MQKLIKTVTLSVALSLVSGCSYFGVYKRDLPQGNLVTQDMVSQLQPGMSREQVRYVMGAPLLEAPFDASQWDYVFRLDEAYGDVDQRRVTLTFADDRLVNIASDGDLSRDIELTTPDSAGPVPEGAGVQENIVPQPAPQEGPEAIPDGGPGTVPTGGEPADEPEPDIEAQPGGF
ncbi:outer membrane protein assembly factor BamE [Litchfieldella xinjiangensis]|uniref:outer membrane protein assembly factor BamE n=1 Tax=Litchfieldella xinjiangensis TaxID=1166948 RepID=UPI0005BC0B1C|nr:outer membrane protein assembly factor BamE [Halomonas xinjiangensis]